MIDYTTENIPSAVAAAPSKPARPLPTPLAAPVPGKARPLGLPTHLNGDNDPTPRSSVAGSPAPEDTAASSTAGAASAAPEQQPPKKAQPDADAIDRTAAAMPLHRAILASIDAAATTSSGDDERRRRDLFGSIMLIGGGSKTPNLGAHLEAQLRAALPQYPREILVAPPPKDLDPEILVWKGASVFGKLRATNDSWIDAEEYDMLGSRLMTYKCMWHW